MKTCSKLAVFIVILLVILVAYFNFQHVNSPGASVAPTSTPVMEAQVPDTVPDIRPAGAPQPAPSETPTFAPEREKGFASPVGGPGLPPTPAVLVEPIRKKKTVELLRIDFSGIYALPDNFTFNNVLEVYNNGKAMDRNRIAVIDNDRIDIFDACLDSRITALIEY